LERAEITARDKVFNILVFAACLIPVFIYIFIFMQRISFPFDIEWSEGAALNQVNRILSGNTVYLKPDLDYAPLVYTPLFYYLAALITSLYGNALFVMRLISVVGSLGAAGLIFGMVYWKTKDFLASWISGSLFLACFSISDGFFDLARVDSIYVLLVLIGLLIIQRAKSRWAYLGAGLWIAITFFVKQSGLIVFLPMVIYLVVTDFRRSWTLLVGSLLAVIIPVLVIDQQTQGWFLYYVLDLPALHGYSWLSLMNFWVGDILSPLGIAVGLAIYYLWIGRMEASAESSNSGLLENGVLNPPIFARDQIWEKDRVLLLLFCGGAVASAWITRSTNGGGANNCMSAYAAISLMAGLGFYLVISRAGQKMFGKTDLSGFLKVLVLVQMIGLVYNPFNYLPSQADVQANEIVFDSILGTEGQVFIPYRSHLPVMAGKGPQIHMINLFEITGYFQNEVQPEGRELVNKIRENICEQEYSLVVLDQPIPWIESQLNLSYEHLGNQPGSELGKRSEVLSWQEGDRFRYAPKQIYDVQECINLID
jgi:hypothetical protein